RVDLGEAAATDRLELKGMYAFSASYWYIVGLCVVFYSTVFPFRAFAIDYFQQAHGLARETAGMLSSLLPVAAIIVTPLFGLWVDRVGRRSLFMAIGSLAMLPLFLLVTYAPPGPDIPMPFTDGTRVPLTLLVVMLMLGGVFSLIPAVMWPAVAYIVRESRLGSAYSMMTLCQQVGVALVPLVVGRFNTAFGAGPEHPAGYAPGMWFYTALAALGLLFSYLLWRAESVPAAHGLEYPSGEKPAGAGRGRRSGSASGPAPDCRPPGTGRRAGRPRPGRAPLPATAPGGIAWSLAAALQVPQHRLHAFAGQLVDQSRQGLALFFRQRLEQAALAGQGHRRDLVVDRIAGLGQGEHRTAAVVAVDVAPDQLALQQPGDGAAHRHLVHGRALGHLARRQARVTAEHGHYP